MSNPGIAEAFVQEMGYELDITFVPLSEMASRVGA